MTKAKTKFVGVRIPLDLARKLDTAAGAQRTNQSTIVRQALDLFLAAKGTCVTAGKAGVA